MSVRVSYRGAQPFVFFGVGSKLPFLGLDAEHWRALDLALHTCVGMKERYKHAHRAARGIGCGLQSLLEPACSLYYFFFIISNLDLRLGFVGSGVGNDLREVSLKCTRSRPDKKFSSGSAAVVTIRRGASAVTIRRGASALACVRM